jgi:hypothetical protein
LLCSNIETGIGCIASSLPSLRYFIQKTDSQTSSKGLSQRQGGGTKTNSESRVRRTGGLEDDWEELQDGDSDRSVALLHTKGIQKESTFEVDIELRGMEQEKKGSPRF